jgi:hypothetical protein
MSLLYLDMAWFHLIPTCGFKQTMERAYSALRLTTQYKLGEGGFNPVEPLTPQCDCSGFIAWTIGIPREFPPGSNKWLSTTEYWTGGFPVQPGLLSQVELHQAQVGDLLVYPHQNGQVGHIALINEVSNNQPAQILHCSSGNFKDFGNAVKITSTDVFFEREQPTRVMRINYNVLKQLPWG